MLFNATLQRFLRKTVAFVHPVSLFVNALGVLCTYLDETECAGTGSKPRARL